MTKTRRRSLIALGIIGALTIAGIIAWRLSVWDDFPGTVRGVPIEGDANAPSTHWWNHWYLARWGWKTVVVFEISEADALAGYDVGYQPYDGGPKVQGRVNFDRRFRMKIGHEDCTFFAIASGKEIPITAVTRTSVDDPAYTDAPLH